MKNTMTVRIHHAVVLAALLGLMVAWIFATAYIISLGFIFYLRFLGGKWKAMRVIERRVEVPMLKPTKLGRVAKL